MIRYSLSSLLFAELILNLNSALYCELFQKFSFATSSIYFDEAIKEVELPYSEWLESTKNLTEKVADIFNLNFRKRLRELNE